MRFFGLFLLLSSILWAQPEAKSEDELLFARRVIEFWRDHEQSLAKQQIESFLIEYPQSEFRDHFQAILGDIALEQSHMYHALALYQKIQNPEVRKQVRPKRWYALYQLKSYSELYQETAPLLTFLESPEECFYFAEAAFRSGLSAEADEQQRLFQEALSVYDQIKSDEQFGGHASLAMAEIYRQLDQWDKAAELYLNIADKTKSQQMLFHAAMMLSEYEPDKACELFSQIARAGSKKAAEAASQWLQILANQKNWDVLVRERRTFLSTLSEADLPVYHFYLGMVRYEQSSWDEATTALRKALESGLKPPHDRAALLAMMHCTKETVSLEGTDFAYQLVKQRYPEEIEQAALLRAISYRKSGKDQIAMSLFSEVIAMGEEPRLLEEAYLEKTHLLMAKKEWIEAHALATQFLNRFAGSERSGAMTRLLVDLSLVQLKEEGGTFHAVAEDVERALENGVLTAQERATKQLLLAKCYLKTDRAPLARQLLLDLPESAETCYLITLSFLKETTCAQDIIQYGEQALAYDPAFSEADRLHLYLFNAYLQQSQTSQDPMLTEKAAAHLYIGSQTLPISLENQLWLAHTYAKEKMYHPRALTILETILPTEAQQHRFQEEALLLATLYEEEERYSEAKNLLEKLLVFENESIETRVHLHLATIYKSCNQISQAARLFQGLENCVDPAIAYPARLEQARIALSTGENIEIALKKLKELWVRKSIATEPIHLEAALDYADYQAAFSSEEEHLKVLEMIKEHFITQSDIWSKDYHEQRLAQPDKDLLYQAYMRYLDAKIYLAQSKRERNEAKEKAAYALFSTLKQGKYAVTKYLVDKTKD